MQILLQSAIAEIDRLSAEFHEASTALETLKSRLVHTVLAAIAAEITDQIERRRQYTRSLAAAFEVADLTQVWEHRCRVKELRHRIEECDREINQHSTKAYQLGILVGLQVTGRVDTEGQYAFSTMPLQQPEVAGGMR